MKKRTVSAYRGNGVSAFSIYADTPTRPHADTRRNGQAMSEFVLLVPLFVLLAGGMLFVGHVCWQGIKVQQAANLAARINGQERISGGYAPEGAPSVGVTNIRRENGLDGSKDRVPEDSELNSLANNRDALQGHQGRPPGGVYGKMYRSVRKMFGASEQSQLFVPPPVHVGINTDTVQVVRVIRPFKIGDMQTPAIKLEAYAYGGEDSHLYGLPRWGRIDSQTPFYATQITNPNSD